MSKLLELADAYAEQRCGATREHCRGNTPDWTWVDKTRVALVEEIERVERDAARYRHLRDGDAYEGWLPDYWNGRGKARHEFTFNSDIQDVDAAIDAAIEAAHGIGVKK